MPKYKMTGTVAYLVTLQLNAVEVEAEDEDTACSSIRTPNSFLSAFVSNQWKMLQAKYLDMEIMASDLVLEKEKSPDSHPGSCPVP